MTKRMIDADSLDKLIEWIDKNYEYCKDIHDIEKKAVSFKFLLDKINELATPEPKESIFDIENLKWEIKNSLNYFLLNIEQNTSVTPLLQALENSIKIQVYLELENKNDTTKQ